MAYAFSPRNICLLELPDEVLAHILSYLPLPDLANTRLICSRLQSLIDNSNQAHLLWSKASLEGVWTCSETLAIFEKAAKHGNVEALIKLAVAYLYSEGVPDGPGKGTLKAINGRKAAEYLKKAETLICHKQPFSWVLIRPPFATTCICCKACVCQEMKQYCTTTSDEELVTNLFYVIGKALSFYEYHESEERHEAFEWFKQGSEHGCPYSAFESWKAEQALLDEVQSIRLLRRIATRNTCTDAQFELCKAYSRGQFGGVSRTLAYLYIQQVMKNSPLLLSSLIYDTQPDITQDMMFILLDWIVEVSEMKEFSTRTLHLAINLVQRYMMARKLSRSRLQLLGVTALLLAARWTDMTIITIREAAWLSDNTYRYDEVVRMVGEIVATLNGEIQKPLVPDYLDILLTVVSADNKTKYLTAYLSESSVLFPDFGRYTCAQLAGACLLLARILLKQDYPWPCILVEATGINVPDLYQCTLLLYTKCLVDDSPVVDYRGIKLCAIKTRYATDRFLSVSEIKFMTYDEMRERLGIIPVHTPTPSPSHSQKQPFLHDDDSIVSQSFVNNFNAQTISESVQVSPRTFYSPRASVGSLLPSPIAFDSSSDVSTCSPFDSIDANHSILDQRPSSSEPWLAQGESSFHFASSPYKGRQGQASLSSSLPLLDGIEPLHSEETVNFNLPLLKSTSSSTRQECHLHPTEISQENQHSTVKTTPKNTRRPLSAINNLLHSSSSNHKQSHVEKRISLDSQQNLKKSKRHCSALSLL